VFAVVSGVTLFITGSAKLFSIFGRDALLDFHDPVTGLSFRYLLLFVGLLEVVIAYVCFDVQKLSVSIELVAWLSTGFLFYRCGLFVLGWRRFCPCLGSLTGAIHVSSHTADTAMKIILGYLLIGSYSTLFFIWREKRKSCIM
jgi:CHASE2 domain-containing sensor protein